MQESFLNLEGRGKMMLEAVCGRKWRHKKSAAEPFRESSTQLKGNEVLLVWKGGRAGKGVGEGTVGQMSDVVGQGS